MWFINIEKEKREKKKKNIKIDSFLKFAGLTETGGIAKEVIAEGRIKVNGEVCTARGKKLRHGDSVTVEEIGITFEIIQEG